MPLTSDQERHISRKLATWLEGDKRVVTFREVAREAGCHVDLAKNLLLSHARKNPSLGITYLLSGPLLSTASLATTQLPTDAPKLDAKALAALEASQRVKIVDMDEVSDGERNSEEGTQMGEAEEGGMDVDDLWGNDKGASGGISGKGDRKVRIDVEDALITPEETPRWGVVMAAREQFEDKRALFDPSGLSIHIYALSPGPVTDPAQYLVSNTLLRQYPNYNDPKYGGITGDLRAAAIASSSSGFSSKTAGLKDGGMDFSTGPAKGMPKEGSLAQGVKGKIDKKGSEPVKKEKEAAAKVEEKKDVNPLPARSASSTGAAASRATAASTKGKDVKGDPEIKPKASEASSSSTSRKPSQTQSQKSKKRIITSDDEGADTTVPEHPTTDTADPEPGASRTQTSSVVRADDQAAMEAMMGMDFEMDMDAGDEEVEEVEEVEEKPKVKAGSSGKSKSAIVGKSATGGAGGRKRRKVKKSRTEMDEKGYMVTKDYTSEESYSGDSDPEPSASKAKSKSKPKAPLRKSSAAGGQSRASSVSTETNDDPPRKGSVSMGASNSSVGSNAKAGAGAGGGTGSGAGGAGAGGGGGRPGMPPKNVPGKPGKPRGQSTLAGFFKKK